jgi:hypothetical protein
MGFCCYCCFLFCYWHERLLLCEREVLSVEPSGIIRSSAGCAERGETERRRKNIC